MRKANPVLYDLFNPVVSAMGYELLGIEHIAQGRHSVLRIFIDQESGITLDDCEQVSRQVSALLDVEDPIKGNYSLEVSSPGMDRPLFEAEHFRRYIGEVAQIRLSFPFEGRRKFQGTIEAVDGEQIKLRVEGETYEFNLDDMDTAHLVPQF
jgi:ribosome maturation factor RimP